jgi:uncharacterized protein
MKFTAFIRALGLVLLLVIAGAVGFAWFFDPFSPVVVQAAVLLVCGEKDEIWPACLMADQVKARAKAMNGPAVQVLAYDDAGHAVFGLPVEKTDERYQQLGTLGGSAEGNNAARADSWPKALQFLAQALK